MSKIKLGKCLWMEDDVPYIDRETFSQAIKRLFNKAIGDFKIIKEMDMGDETYQETEDGYIFVRSYPGNSAIYETVKE